MGVLHALRWPCHAMPCSAVAVTVRSCTLSCTRTGGLKEVQPGPELALGPTRLQGNRAISNERGRMDYVCACARTMHHGPWGCIVRVGGLTKSGKLPASLFVLPLFLRAWAARGVVEACEAILHARERVAGPGRAPRPRALHSTAQQAQHSTASTASTTARQCAVIVGPWATCHTQHCSTPVCRAIARIFRA